jgi:hypothetical protein
MVVEGQFMERLWKFLFIWNKTRRESKVASLFPVITWTVTNKIVPEI